MPLEMKYFVLKPSSKTPRDPFALASREAMRAYAKTIADTDADLATQLIAWARIEATKEMNMEQEGGDTK